MKMKHVIIGALFLVAVLTSCIQNEIHDSFVRVNDSLEQVTHKYDSIINGQREILAQNECFNDLLISDTLRGLNESVSSRCDTLKSRMIEVAPGNYMIADSAYALNGTGERLHKDLKRLFEHASTLLQNEPEHTELVDLLRILDEPPPPETWRVRNFYHVPAVAAITVLSKFQADVARAESLCMQKLLRDCGRGRTLETR